MFWFSGDKEKLNGRGQNFGFYLGNFSAWYIQLKQKKILFRKPNS